MSGNDVEHRLALIEDERAIQALVYRYGRLIDEGAAPAEIAALFTEDGVWSVQSADGGAGFGARNGRADIEDHFATVGDSVGGSLHAVSSPEIAIESDGRSAAGRWYTLTLLAMAGEAAQEAPARLLGATGRHRYVKDEGGWRFARVETTLHFQLPMAGLTRA
jgi:hypothetical protein